jgi:hypothetical protein
MISLPLQYALGLDQYRIDLGEQFMWMIAFELVYMFIDTVRITLSYTPPDEFRYKMFGFSVSQPIVFTPEQKARHKDSAQFMRKFALIAFIITALLLAVILPGQTQTAFL